MKGVIYARYSSSKQREESIEGQIRENTAFANKNGIEIVGTYIDRAQSAKTDDRPEFKRMIKESSWKKYDVIIVWKLDRLARNRYDSAKYKAILLKSGKKVVSATEAISEGPAGHFLEAVLEGMAAYYSDELSEKVTRGMTENALKCRYNGGHAAPFGFSIDADKHYQIDPATAPIALEIFTRYADGESIKSIIGDLNGHGVKTSRGTPFNKSSIINMVHNRNYIGEYHFGKTIIPNGIPAIIPEEIFNRATERANINKHAPAQHKAKEKYILTTKLFCGECMSMMVGDSVNKKDRTYRYYKCASAKRHECDLKPVRKELIEDYVIKKTMESISDDKTMTAIVNRIMKIYNKENTIIPALEEQLKKTRSSIENILKAIESGVITKSTKSRLEKLEAEEEELVKEIEDERYNKPPLTKEMVWFVIDKYRNLDMTIEKDREKLIDGLVGKIILYGDGRLIITFNYKNEPVETTLDEISAAATSSSDINNFGSPIKKHCCCSAFLLVTYAASGTAPKAHGFDSCEQAKTT